MLSTFSEQSIWLRPNPNRDNKSMMEILFGRMSGMYPNKWGLAFPDDKAIKAWEETWIEAFDREGITPHDVGLGVQNCLRMFDWPPSLPEFLRACRPHLEADVAFFEAIREMRKRSQGEDGQFSHPAIYHAAVMIGQYDLLNGNYQTLGSRWKAVLTAQLSLGQWAEVPAVLKELPAPERTEEQKQAARRVTAMVASAPQNSKSPYRWIEKILTNPKACGWAKDEAIRIANERNIDISKFQNVVRFPR